MHLSVSMKNCLRFCNPAFQSNLVCGGMCEAVLNPKSRTSVSPGVGEFSWGSVRSSLMLHVIISMYASDLHELISLVLSTQKGWSTLPTVENSFGRPSQSFVSCQSGVVPRYAEAAFQLLEDQQKTNGISTYSVQVFPPISVRQWLGFKHMPLLKVCSAPTPPGGMAFFWSYWFFGSRPPEIGPLTPKGPEFFLVFFWPKYIGFGTNLARVARVTDWVTALTERVFESGSDLPSHPRCGQSMEWSSQQAAFFTRHFFSHPRTPSSHWRVQPFWAGPKLLNNALESTDQPMLCYIFFCICVFQQKCASLRVG